MFNIKFHGSVKWEPLIALGGSGSIAPMRMVLLALLGPFGLMPRRRKRMRFAWQREKATRDAKAS